jgi:hypothetical protein
MAHNESSSVIHITFTQIFKHVQDLLMFHRSRALPLTVWVDTPYNGMKLAEIIYTVCQTCKYLICGNKMPTRCNRWFLLQILLLAQHVSGTIMPIIRSSRVLYRWLLPVVFGALVFKLSVWCGAEGYVSGLRAAAAYRQLENQSTKYHRQQPSV